jgi:putative transposase
MAVPTLGIHPRCSNPERVESFLAALHPQLMPQSLSNLLVHTVFSTKHRHPFLHDKELRTELHRYLGGVLTNLNCPPLMVGGTEDHVHILSNLAIKELKRSSSIWLKTKSPQMEEFAWQGGYGIFSIGYVEIEAVRTYISKQEEHHRKISFQDELRQLLNNQKIAFDERYIWD